MRPEVDLTNEDQSRNISRRHARARGQGRTSLFIAEEIGTMNGTFLNGKKLSERRAHADQRRRRDHAVRRLVLTKTCAEVCLTCGEFTAHLIGVSSRNPCRAPRCAAR